VRDACDLAVFSAVELDGKPVARAEQAAVDEIAIEYERLAF
jgi:hypothetical protein